MGRPGSRRTVGTVLMVSAFALMTGAGLVWAGMIPVAEDARIPVGAALNLVGLLDLAVGFWLIRRGE